MVATLPYAGLRVLDLGQGIAAPHCAMLLAMQGADVIKLEPPAGDWSRGLGTRYGDHTAMSAHYNRGKRGLALDLRAPAAQRLALELALRADILIEGFRPGVAARLGLGYRKLSDRNPRLLYVSVSGFGQHGPYVDTPCTDSVAQAFSGMMAVNLGNDGAPHRVGAMIVDTVTGLYAAQAVAASLYARERSGRGAWLQVSLAQAAAAMLGHKLAEHIMESGRPRALNVPTGAYRTRDGWIMVALIREADFPRLAAALGHSELAADRRYASFAERAVHAGPLIEALRQIFAEGSTAEWLTRLRAADVLADRINGFDDWLADPQVAAVQGAMPVTLPAAPAFSVPRTPGIDVGVEDSLLPPPGIGEHGRSILAEIGCSPAEIDALAMDGILHLPEPA